jgi:hypothetical protein
MFIGFYEVRKLSEAQKLSERVVKASIEVQTFRFTGKTKLTIFNWNRKLFDAYDFTRPLTARMSPAFLSNQVIHSYIFQEIFDSNGSLYGFYICSDWGRNKKLYHVSLAQTIRLFSSVGNDYPMNFSAILNAKSADYKIKAW